MVGDAFIKIINHDSTRNFIVSHFGFGYSCLLYLHRLLYTIQGFSTTVGGALVKDTNLMAAQDLQWLTIYSLFGKSNSPVGQSSTHSSGLDTSGYPTTSTIYTVIHTPWFGIGYSWLLYLHRLLYTIQGFSTTVGGAFVKDTNLTAVHKCHRFIFCIGSGLDTAGFTTSTVTHTSFRGYFDYGRGSLRQGYQSDGGTGPPMADRLLSLRKIKLTSWAVIDA
jgi:hypothetical protein